MVVLYLSPGSSTEKAAREAIPADLYVRIQVRHAYRDTKPKRGDYVLVSGTAKASKAVEMFAARIGAFPVYVPESWVWLGDQVRKHLAAGTSLVLVDAALASTSQLSGAK